MYVTLGDEDTFTEKIFEDEAYGAWLGVGVRVGGTEYVRHCPRITQEQGRSVEDTTVGVHTCLELLDPLEVTNSGRVVSNVANVADSVRGDMRHRYEHGKGRTQSRVERGDSQREKPVIELGGRKVVISIDTQYAIGDDSSSDKTSKVDDEPGDEYEWGGEQDARYEQKRVEGSEPDPEVNEGLARGQLESHGGQGEGAGERRTSSGKVRLDASMRRLTRLSKV